MNNIKFRWYNQIIYFLGWLNLYMLPITLIIWLSEKKTKMQGNLLTRPHQKFVYVSGCIGLVGLLLTIVFFIQAFF